MFWGKTLPELATTSSFRQALTIAFVFLLVTLGSIVISRHLIEHLMLAHVSEMVLKDINTQILSTRLKSTNTVAETLHHRELYDQRPERRSLVVDANGVVRLGDPALLPVMTQKFPTCNRDYCTPVLISPSPQGETLLGLRVTLLDGGQYYSAYDIQPMMDRVRVIPFIAGSGLFAVLLLALLLSARFGLSNLERVDSINKTLQRYARGHRSTRIAIPRRQDEFARLGQEINLTLDRIDSLVEEVKSTSGHIAHEMRTPLTRLQNRLMSVSENAPQPLQDEVLGAVDEISRLHHLSRSIMRLGEIEAGRCNHHFAPIPVADLLRDVVETYLPVAEEHDSALTFVTSTTMDILGDRNLLFQALTNLLDNALKYTPAGTPLMVQAQGQDDRIILSVIDRGPGIPEAQRTTALQRFRRLANAQDRPGSGMGLAFVVAIVRLHRGTLQLADSHPGLTVSLSLRGISSDLSARPQSLSNLKAHLLAE